MTAPAGQGPAGRRDRTAGFSYVEVLLSIVLIALALVPAMEALLPATQGMAIHASMTQRHYRLGALLEDLLAQPFAELDAEAVAISDPGVVSALYSDPPGTADRRLVYLSRYDGDNADPADDDPFTGVDEGLLWIKVEFEDGAQALERLTSQYD